MDEWARYDWRKTHTGPSTTHSMLQIRAWGHNSPANPEKDDLPLPTTLVCNSRATEDCGDIARKWAMRESILS